MNQDQKNHLNKIVTQTSDRIRVKYERGQREHQDNLWERPVFRDVIDECTDLQTYLVTLEAQLRQMWTTVSIIKVAMLEGRIADADRALDDLDAAFRMQIPPA